MSPFRLFLCNLILPLIPETRLFGIKRALYRFCGITIGKNVRICSSARIIGSGNLSIKENTWIGPQSLLLVSANVVIGENCDIAPRTCIVTGSHKINLITENKIAGEGYNLPIHIGNGCWICIGATILGGSDIGDCSIVAAGSIVKGTFPKRQLICGTLAKGQDIKQP
nr:acyltransferase [uncultured Alloprevotella sp.]